MLELSRRISRNHDDVGPSVRLQRSSRKPDIFSPRLFLTPTPPQYPNSCVLPSNAPASNVSITSRRSISLTHDDDDFRRCWYDPPMLTHGVICRSGHVYLSPVGSASCCR